MLNNRARLPVGGFLSQSLVDFPGHIAAVVYTMGCNFRCPFCHNPELVEPSRYGTSPAPDFEEVLFSIARNRELLDGVVVTGGEPTLHQALPEALGALRSLGLKIKLDTNGTRPDMLKLLVSESLVDEIAMDIKAPFDPDRYSALAGVPCSGDMLERILESVSILQRSAIRCIFRCTEVKGLHTEKDVSLLKTLVGGSIVFQKFRAGKTLSMPLSGMFGEGDLPALSALKR